MTKAPRRSVASPDDSGALPVFRRPVQPRSSNGKFVKADAALTEAPLPQPLLPQPKSDTKRVVPRSKPRKSATPTQLVTRVTRAIERELEEIESIVGGERTEADKRARTLASLARTLAEVARLRETAREAKDAAKVAAKSAKAEKHDDALPRDLDEFRRTLERRLAQMADPGEISLDRADEPG